jgi:hypothetical protein
MTDKEKEARTKRLETVNEFVRVIAGCGRQFFNYEGKGWGCPGAISQFEFDHRWRLWWRNGYRNNRIYTHFRDYRKFSGLHEGGTLQSLIERLCDFILKGLRLPSNYFSYPKWACGGDVWGYGEDWPKIAEAAEKLGIIEARPADG